MQRETLTTVKHTPAFSASILQAWRRFSANCGDQIVGISNDGHCLRLLLNVLDLDLLLLLLLLGGLLLGSGGGSCCLLLSLSLRLSLKIIRMIS